MHSFFRFLVWYAVLIIAFGLGFYIMLHKDVGKGKDSKTDSNDTKTNANNCPEKEEPYGYFDTPWIALVKTSTMFIGEIEFSDIPIEGGNVSVTFGYLFLLAFVFLIVMVLMNLLNGLAVSDIAEIVSASEIEGNISTINTISYFESVLLGDPLRNDGFEDTGGGFCDCVKKLSLLQVSISLEQMGRVFFTFEQDTQLMCISSLLQALYAACPCLRRLFQKLIGSTGMLLFYSYLTEKQLSLPLKQSPGCTNCICPCEEENTKRYVMKIEIVY